MQVLSLCFPASMWPRVVKSKLWVGWSRRFLPDLSFHNLKPTHIPLSKMGFTSKWMPRKGNLPPLGPLFPKWKKLVPFGVCAQSCPTLCDPMNCSPTDSSVHGIFQARIPERMAISSSRGSSWTRDWTCVSCISGVGRQICFFFFLTLCHLGSRCLLDQVSHLNPFIPLCLEGTAVSGCSMGGLLWARSLGLVKATLAGAQNGRYSSALRPQGYN